MAEASERALAFERFRIAVITSGTSGQNSDWQKPTLLYVSTKVC